MKIGRFEIPDMRLYPTLFEATKKIYEKFKSEEAIDQLTVAKLLGHKSASGAFLRKIANLRAYGLITRRGIKVTDVGKQLTYATSDEERNEALRRALLNIPLWKEFHSRWSVTLPTVDFWVDLSNITGLEAPDAQNAEDTIRKAYLEDIQYLKPIKKPKKEVLGMESLDRIEKTTPTLISVDRQANIVQNLIKEGAYDIAKNFIDFIKEKNKKEEDFELSEESEEMDLEE